MDELIKLSKNTLSMLPARVARPEYDRASLTAGIVHIGLGNFHRGHQAWYLHRLFNSGVDHDWAIIGAGVRPGDASQRERLQSQDWLTTLIELDPSGKSAEVIGSMIDYVPVEADNSALIAQMADPAIRIVSLTVTEGGYYTNPASGGFDAVHPDILHDAEFPSKPMTAFGAMIAALKKRREAGHGPFTALSCDNLQGNGAILRRSIVELARMSDASLAEWIDTNCSFPNSMVDCIVPATGPKEIALAHSFGIDDATPVTHENFRQWVIEDDFCAGRPRWDEVGAVFSRDVHAYEAMKLRILNGGHQIIAVPGELLGLATIADAMSHPLIRGLLHKVMEEEVVPHVKPVPGMVPMDYLALIDRRFSNPEIEDTTRRVAFDGSSRQSGFLVPSIRDGLDAGTPVSGLALASALWCRYCEGSREDGSVVEPNDPNWAELNQVAIASRRDPALWLGQKQFYGDLAQNTLFASAFSHWHHVIAAKGTESAIRAFLSSGGQVSAGAKLG